MGEHYYTRAGKPMHFIEKADGSGLRATTLRDARKLGLVPSFSTVDSIRNKYALNRYLIRDAVRIAYSFDKDQFVHSPAPDETFADFVMEHLAETKGERTGSDMGTEIHDAIEQMVTMAAGYVGPYYEHASAALDEVARLFPDVEDWEAEKTFANPMGFGGMCDLHSPSTGILVDFKTKDGELDRKLAYDQFIQLACYQRGLMLPPNVAANVFVSRTHPGVVASHVWTLDDLAKGWDMFQHEFGLWCLDKSYDPSFVPGEEEAAA